ncbi:MAG: hypothetical protein V3R94_02255 [Acidobacteriota bacterium]
MEGLAWGIGILLVMIGPFLLIPVTWILYRYGARPVALAWLVPRISDNAARLTALMVSLLLVGVTLAVSFFPGQREYARLCAEYSVPMVSDRVMVEGFYRNRLYPYEASQFLDGDSFKFVEAPDMYKEGSYIRYSRSENEEIHQEEIGAPASRYGVREDFSELSYGIVMTRKTVYDMESSRELANAASIVYMGGPLSLFLGVQALSSCPEIISSQGAEHFNTFYNLETVVLRADD